MAAERGRKPAGNRVFGPFAHGDRWRVVARGPGIQEAFGSPEKWSTRADEKAAQRVADEWRAAFIADEMVGPHVALEEWSDSQRAQGLRERTIADREWRIGALLDGSGVATVADLRPQHVRAWLAGEYGRGDALARESQAGHLRALRRWMGWCKARGYRNDDPSVGLVAAGKRRVGKPRLTETELHRLDAVCAAEWSEPSLVVHLLLRTGARPDEVLSMRVRDLVLDRVPPRWGVAVSKTESGIGTGLLPYDWHRHGAGALIPIRLALHVDGRGLGEWVFPASRGSSGHRVPTWLGEHFHRLCGVAGVVRHGPDGQPVTIPPYSLRGSGAALLRPRHHDPDAMASALGHSGSRVTVEHYIGTDVEREARRSALQDRLR